MFFEIHGLKEINEEKENIQILVSAENPGIIRDFFMSKNIIVLSIKKYKEDPVKFGNISWTFIEKNDIFPFIEKGESIKKTCFLLTHLGFTLDTIKSSDEILSEEDIKKLIKTTYIQVQKEEEEQEEEIIIEKEEARKVYEDTSLKKLQYIVDEIFSYINKLIPKIQDHVEHDKIQELKKEEELLRKLRMGRNSKTMKEILEKTLFILEDLKNTYIESIKKDWTNIFERSVVTDVDIINEYNKFKKSTLIKGIKIKQSKEDQFYVFFDKIWLFVKFLTKDIIHYSKQILRRLSKTFDIAEFMIAVIIVELWVGIWSNKLLYFSENLDHFFIFMIHLGVIWLWIWIVKKFLKINFTRIFILIAVCLIWYFVVIKVLKLFFAL